MEGSRVLSCPRKREKTIIKERKERREERGGDEKKSWTLNLSGSKGGKVRSVDYHFDQSRYRGFAVQTIFAVRFFLLCRANNVCRAFFSHFTVQTIFTVRFSVTLPCKQSLPCVFLSLCRAYIFAVRLYRPLPCICFPVCHRMAKAPLPCARRMAKNGLTATPVFPVVTDSNRYKSDQIN